MASFLCFVSEFDCSVDGQVGIGGWLIYQQILTLTLMNCESLYQQSKWKRQHQRMLEQEQAELIRQMSSSKKINPHSHNILASKISEKLTQFRDDEVLNIQTSIPLLHAAKILQAIQSIQSAKQKLENGEFENSRLKEEARFVYCLWKMVDEEEIEVRQLKEIIYMLNDKQTYELVHSLSEIYRNEEAVSEFVETWKVLMHDNQYYRSIQKIEKKKQTAKENKEIERIMEIDSRGLKDICFNQSSELKDYFLNSKCLSKSSKMLTHDTIQFSSKNKENSIIDKSRQEAIISRLYDAQKYKVRQIQKKLEEEKREREMLESCTFKPQLIKDRLRSASANKRSSSINGYNKAVHRMKVGQEKTRIQKEKKEYKPIGQNYEKLREMKPNPPKFLQRKKQSEPVLFVIQFDLGRHKVKIKVHESDRQEAIAQNLCKIYCLKQQYYSQICAIIKKQREIFQADQYK